MKKNGFIFAETIIVLAVVLSGLIMLYSTFNNVLQREKIISSYNKTEDIYHLNSMKKYLESIDQDYYADGMIVPRVGPGSIVNVNTGSNSNYFRLECQCHDLVNEAYSIKYPSIPTSYCEDNYEPIYFNYCAALNNHLNIKEIYIIRNTRAGINDAITQMIFDESQIIEEDYFVEIAGNTIQTPRYIPNLISQIKGIPRRANATLVDYIKTISPIQSTIASEDWSSDYIIIGEFYNEGAYTYAHLRFEG